MNNNMLKIDLKDRKILYQLDINSRQSYSQIAKKVGLSKTVLVYRINRLKEKGVIRKFYTELQDFIICTSIQHQRLKKKLLIILQIIDIPC
jgi:DNA-binding Lrp family transcriptional regulator